RCFFEGEHSERRPARFIGMALDVTYRKKTEEELLAAKEAAEVGIRIKSQFIANVSHEIRTPINGILGTIELLRQTPLSFEQKEYVDVMDDSGGTLMDLVSELLDFSRIEAGKLKLEIKSFNLLTLLDAVLALFVGRIQFKKLELITQIAKD